MQVAIYARVSTQHQAQAQTIEQQLERMRAYIEQQGWVLEPENIFRDDGVQRCQFEPVSPGPPARPGGC